MSVHTFAVQSMAPGSGSSNQAKPGQTTKCSVCPKVFKRSEHCARHELSHTNEKPFSCQFCFKTYARKDLVKRHERTIHAGDYNALVNPTTSGNKERTGNPGRSSQPDADATTIRVRAVTGEDTLPAQTKSTATKRATASDGSGTIPAGSTTSPSRVSPTSSFLPNCFTALDTTSPVTGHGLSMSAIHTHTTGLSSPQSRLASSERFDFNTGDLLVASPFTSIEESSEDAANVIEPSQQQNKRQRLSVDGSSARTIQNNLADSMCVSLSFPSFPANFLHPPDLMDFDLITGGVGEEFFNHQITQDQDRFSDLNGHTGTLVPGVSDDSELTFRNAIATMPSDQLTDSLSESGTDRTKRTRLPRILKEKSETLPRFLVDDEGFRALAADLKQRAGNSDIQLPLKNRRELQHFLNGYLDSFHRHLPLLHLPTLEVAQTPSPLILAMCCIGALYRLERQKARNIYRVASAVAQTLSINYLPSSPLDSRSSNSPGEPTGGQAVSLKPLWLMQARILLLLYAVLGNDGATTQAELGIMGVFITEYRTRRSNLETRSRNSIDLTWQEWVEVEAAKRFLCGMFICSSLIVVIYDIAPGVGITQDLEFEMLEEETLWNAATAEDWRNLRGSKSPLIRRTIRSVMEDMLAGRTNDNGETPLYYVSRFTTLVVIHAVNKYAWILSQVSRIDVSPFSGPSGVASNTLLTNALLTLTRCREVLKLATTEGIESLWDSPDGPLLLNCEAMLRVAYTRLFLSPSMPEGLVLLLGPSSENIGLLTTFLNAPQERTPLITKVMANMCEAFSVPSKAGYLLVRKTAAINWSVEHAVAGWSCVLLLSKWLHCLNVDLDDTPLSSAELDIVSEVKIALESMNIDYDENSSLAARVVASWAPLMTDVWVWGVTTKMGAIFEDLAQLYESSSRTARRHRLRL